jgi:hypothetical protein
VQHPQQASHEFSYPGMHNPSRRLPFQHLLEAETPLDAVTDVTHENTMDDPSIWPVFPESLQSGAYETHENTMDDLSTWPVFESREQPLQHFTPDEVAFQYIMYSRGSQMSRAAFDCDVENIMDGPSAWSARESREQPLQQFAPHEFATQAVAFQYRMDRAETPLGAKTDMAYEQQDNQLV